MAKTAEEHLMGCSINLGESNYYVPGGYFCIPIDMSKGVLSHPNNVLGGTFVYQLTCPRGFLVIQRPRGTFCLICPRGFLIIQIMFQGDQLICHPNNAPEGGFV